MIRVAIADDQTMVRASFRLLLEQDDELQVVGEASTGSEAVAVARRDLPDIMLMDIEMPQMDGIEATRLISRSSQTPHTRVIMLTTFDLRPYIEGALDAGAKAFVLKHGHPDELLHAIRVVHAGESFLAPSVTTQLIKSFTTRPGRPVMPARAFDTLTDREEEVLRLVAAGLSNAEIADRLRLTMSTVKTHMKHLLAKVGVRDRGQLIAVAYQSGLMRFDEVKE